MARLSAEKHSQIVALLQTGHGISETARKCQCSRPTVYAVKAELDDRAATPSRPSLTKLQVMENVRTVAESTDSRPTDKLSAWKLYAMMMGYLSENEGKAAQVNVLNMISAPQDIAKALKSLETEYAQITQRILGKGDDTYAPTADVHMHEAQIVDNTGDAAQNCSDEGGGGPPGDETETK